MAAVDFSNARISVDPTRTKSPIFPVYLNLGSNYFSDSNGNVINTGTFTRDVDEQSKLSYKYSGTFTASGTEFYFGDYYSWQQRWHISNITFRSGDTYEFKVTAYLQQYIQPTPVIADSCEFWATVQYETILTFDYEEEEDVPVHVIVAKENANCILFYGYYYSTSMEGYCPIAVANYNNPYADRIYTIPSIGFSVSYIQHMGTWGIIYPTNSSYPVGANEYEAYLGEFSGPGDAATALVDRIVATPFQYDYQIGTTYNLTTTNIRKTIRKALSTALLASTPSNTQVVSMPPYCAFANNVDTFVDELVNKTSGSELIYLDVQTLQYGVTIDFYYGAGISGVNNAHVTNATTENYRTYYEFKDANNVSSIHPSSQYRIEIDSNGDITRTDLSPSQDIPYWAGMALERSTALDSNLRMTNLGIDL